MSFIKSRFFALFYIGIANAISLPLKGNVLSIWLTESHYSKEMIGFFGLLGLPFSFKIFWSPVVDYLAPPLFSHEPRKGWLISALISMAGILMAMSCIDPVTQSLELALCIFALSLSAGCIYVTGIAYEIESLDEPSYPRGSAYVISGYRVGLLIAGAGALYLSALWDWSYMFRVMAGFLMAGSSVIWLQPEPHKSSQILLEKRQRLAKSPSLWQGFWSETFFKPSYQFWGRIDCFGILCVIFLFKLGDELMTGMSGPFYLSLGFSKVDLATASKVWGMAATLLGAFFVVPYLKKIHSFSAIAKLSLLHAVTLPLHLLLSIIGKSYPFFYLLVAAEHFTSGMAMTAFIAMLWRVCERHCSTAQYMILWSLYLFKGRFLAFFGAILAAQFDWTTFFAIVVGIALASAVGFWAVCHRLDNLATPANEAN